MGMGLYLELGRPIGAQLACEHLFELFARHDVGGRAHALQNAGELRRNQGLILCASYSNRRRKGTMGKVMCESVCVSKTERRDMCSERYKEVDFC